MISQHSSWRWIFLLNVPCGVVVTLTLFFTWRSPGPFQILRWYSATYHMPVSLILLTRIDLLGVILLLGSSVFLIFAMQEAGSSSQTWNSPPIIGTLSTFAACLVCLIAWVTFCHYKFDKKWNFAIFPIRLVASRILAATLMWVMQRIDSSQS